MKRLLFLALLGLACGACRKEEGIWDELSPAERAALRERALRDCISNSNARFSEFKDGVDALYTSASWQRNKAYKHELKNGETVDTTHNVQVWKQSASELYLVVTRTIGSNTPVTYFLRIPNATNDDILDDLQLEVCAQRATLVSSSGSSMTVRKEYKQTVVGGTRETTDTYTMPYALSPYMGTAWRFTRKIVAKDTAGKVTSTTNLVSSWNSVASPTPLNADPNTYGNFYCDIIEPAADAEFPDLRYKAPYLIPEPSTCPTVLPAGWSLAL